MVAVVEAEDRGFGQRDGIKQMSDDGTGRDVLSRGAEGLLEGKNTKDTSLPTWGIVQADHWLDDIQHLLVIYLLAPGLHVFHTQSFADTS